jgi:lysophospholipase L1-like esterase
MFFPNTYLALGDSYTIGESVAPNENFPNLLLQKFKKANKNLNHVQIVAKTGWTTDELQAEINHLNLLEHQFGLVSLLIGVNNQYRGRPVETYAPEFEQLLLQALQLANHQTNKLFVVSIPDYAFTPFGNGHVDITKGIDAYNAVNEAITKKYDIAYFNITPISRKGLRLPHFVAADDLHPSSAQYALWAELIFAKI